MKILTPFFFLFIGVIKLSLYSEENLEPSVAISEIPLVSVYTPNSILSHSKDYNPLSINERKRYATCSGVAWFHDNKYLATVNLLGNAFATYEFEPTTNTIKPLQKFTQDLSYPVNLAFSHDGSLVAVTNSKNGNITIYEVDLQTHLINPTPISIIKYQEDTTVHGIRFSPNSKFLAYTTIDEPGYVRVFKMIKKSNGEIEVNATQDFKNIFIPLKPKGIDFTPDGKFIAICYSGNAGSRSKTNSLLAIFPFDSEEGTINEYAVSVVDETSGLFIPEDIVFFPDSSHLIATNQDNDSVVLYKFNKSSGLIGKSSVLLNNPHSQLSFPHGIAISTDGHYLAVTNLGDDKFNIYRIQN